MLGWRAIGTKIKYIFKTINTIRIILLNIVFFSLLILIMGLFKLNDVPQSGILILDIEGIIVDSTDVDQDLYKINKKLGGIKDNSPLENSLFELTQKIEQATTDKGIKGIVLKLDNFSGASLPALEYLAKYLKQFKAAGKPIYAFGNNFDQKQYYLASLADKIYLANLGSVEIFGFATNNLYFKSLLDKLKVNTYVFRVGTYKSAVEPYIRDDMSEQAKQNTQRWLNSLWKKYLIDISLSRNQEPNTLAPNTNILLERLSMVSGNMADYALENNIVDVVKSSAEFEQEIYALFDTEDTVSIYDYELLPNKKHTIDSHSFVSDHNPKIAVVVVNGAIIQGDSAEGIAGSNTIVEQLRDLSYDDDVRAIVLRIDSPGGSVTGSEAIRSELAALREKDIPIVVSMGGMAASGGYWIATESDYIYASSKTITGSIGIFGVIQTFEDTLSNIGVHTDGVATSPLASVTITKQLPKQFEKLMQMTIDNGYNHFLSLVAQSRNMNYEDVDKLAQGQVWLGEEAQKNGLVDEIGDIDNAIHKAASLAGVSDYSIFWQKQEINLFNSIVNNVSATLPKSFTQMLYNQLPIAKQAKQQITFWNNLNDPQNRYVYCLNCADIK